LSVSGLVAKPREGAAALRSAAPFRAGDGIDGMQGTDVALLKTRRLIREIEQILKRRME